MEYGAIDLHKKESQVRILTESGEVIDQRIRTTRDRLTALFWGRPHARILIEASTESEWVAQHLETLGHEVIVADPNYGLMYGHRSRRVKTIVTVWESTSIDDDSFTIQIDPNGASARTAQALPALWRRASVCWVVSS
jgi:hypothetical protein